MSAEPPALDVDELYTLHVLDQALACLDDASTALCCIQALYPQLNDPNPETTLALLALIRQWRELLTRSRPLP